MTIMILRESTERFQCCIQKQSRWVCVEILFIPRFLKQVENNSVRWCQTWLPEWPSHSTGRLSQQQTGHGQKNEDASLRIIGNKSSWSLCCLFLILQYCPAVPLAVCWDGTFLTVSAWQIQERVSNHLCKPKHCTSEEQATSPCKQVLNKVYLTVMRTENKKSQIYV